jgi:pimeloyl-ACP methyl ester carboxylesterase
MVATVLGEEADSWRGEINDVCNVFLAKSAFCQWQHVTVPTLILHDREDKFVPVVHAELAARHLTNARLRTFHLAGHILWLGPDAHAMHQTRIAFVRGP